MRLERTESETPCPKCGGPDADLVRVSRGWPMTPEEAADPDFVPARWLKLRCTICGYQWSVQEPREEREV